MNIGQNRGVLNGVGHFEHKFGGNGVAHQRLLASENLGPWAITWRYLRDPTFSRFGTVRACARQTNGQTHDDG